MNIQEPNLWRDTPGASFTAKFSVLLLEAKSHQHGKADWKGRKGGTLWVDYNDAVKIAHRLNADKNKAREERR